MYNPERDALVLLPGQELEPMSGFYFDQYAINFLTQLILTLATTLYLLSLKNKTAATRWFIAFFAGMTVYAGVSVIEAASFWVRRY